MPWSWIIIFDSLALLLNLVDSFLPCLFILVAALISAIWFQILTLIVLVTLLEFGFAGHLTAEEAAHEITSKPLEASSLRPITPWLVRGPIEVINLILVQILSFFGIHLKIIYEVV